MKIQWRLHWLLFFVTRTINIFWFSSIYVHFLIITITIIIIISIIVHYKKLGDFQHPNGRRKRKRRHKIPIPIQVNWHQFSGASLTS